MPGDSGVLVVTRVRSINTKCARGRGCSGHPAFPTPSLGRKIHQRLGRFASRGRSRVGNYSNVIATRWLAMTVLQLNCLGCLKIESELGVREEFLGLAPKDSPGDDSKEKPRPEGGSGRGLHVRSLSHSHAGARNILVSVVASRLLDHLHDAARAWFDQHGP